MKSLITNLILGVLATLFFTIGLEQCHRKNDAKAITQKTLNEKAILQRKYLALLESKTRIDTVYKEGKTQYVKDTLFKTITDTFLVEGTDTLLLYESSLERPDLRLKAKIWAKKFHDISYEYNVTEKIVIQNNIVEVHDTLLIKKYKAQLLGIGEIGKDVYSVGLHFQTNKRLGILGKSNWYQGKQYYTLGVAYRIF